MQEREHEQPAEKPEENRPVPPVDQYPVPHVPAPGEEKPEEKPEEEPEKEQKENGEER